LRAVIFECERNPLDRCRAELQALREALDRDLPPHSAWRSIHRSSPPNPPLP
jgi:hypothetical protein